MDIFELLATLWRTSSPLGDWNRQQMNELLSTPSLHTKHQQLSWLTPCREDKAYKRATVQSVNSTKRSYCKATILYMVLNAKHSLKVKARDVEGTMHECIWCKQNTIQLVGIVFCKAVAILSCDGWRHPLVKLV